MFQEITLVGHASEIEERTNKSGKLFLRFGVGVQESKAAPTTWHNCIVSGKFAEVMKDKLSKGQLLFIKGTPTQRKDKESGRVYHNVMVEKCRILRDSRNNAEEQKDQASQEASAQVPGPNQANSDNFSSGDDDIPF